MQELPPLPPGYRLEKAPERDPWEILKAEGFVATNGFRTDADTARIRKQGYDPAPNSDHLRGDGVDLDHPTLTPAQQDRRLRQLFGNRPGFKLIDEGHHRHLSLAGWGAAPGTPGTANSGLPPLPDGFKLQQRGSLGSGNYVDGSAPKPKAMPQRPRKSAGGNALLVPTGAVHDGDTFGLSNGRSGRLFGVDAFELDQPGFTTSGTPYPLGGQSRNALLPFAQPGAVVGATGQSTYGRPVVTLDRGGDAGRALVSQGLAIPEPNYLRSQPDVLADYVGAQRGAIAAERGAYGGTYQNPRDYRREGGSAPIVGKIPMSEPDAREWDAMLRNPATKAEDVTAWLAARGHSAENIGNIMSFLRRNSQAESLPYYQQEDATGAPVQRGGPGVFERTTGALNEGIVDLAATPFDLSHAIARPVGNALGVDMAEQSPISTAIRDAAHSIGVGQTDERFAPRSAFERYGQAFARGTGSAIVPVGGTLAAGSKLALRAPSVATEVSALRSAVRGSMVDAAKAPGTAAALEIGGSAGAYAGGQVADDVAPGNPWVSIPAQIAGGMVAGVAAGRGAQAIGMRGRASAEARAPDDASGNAGAPIIEQAGRTFAQAADGSQVEIPLDPSGNPGVLWVDDHWEALLRVEPDGATMYGPPSNIPSPYRELAAHLNGNARPMGPPEASKAEKLEPPIPQPNAPDDGNSQPRPRPTPIPGQPARGSNAVEPDDRVQLQQHLAELTDIAGRDPETAQDVRATLDRVGREYPFAQALADIRAKHGTAAMSADIDTPTLLGPSVESDNHRPRVLLADPTDADRLAAAQRVEPGDLQPVPATRVADAEEAVAIEKGRYGRVPAGNEDAELSSRSLPHPTDGLKTIRKRGPVDLVTWARTQGGIRTDRFGGDELAHYGIDNEPRRGMDFAQGEGRLGPLINPAGRSLDDLAHDAWEAGYFPDRAEPPTVPEFLGALTGTHSGRNRVFHPDDFDEVDRFEAARAQRRSVEAARESGAPLSVDRSQPASLEDMDANSAPVHAYEEWGENAPDFAGNLRLYGLNSPQDIKRALVRVEKVSGGFDAARRGRITQAETERLAGELNMTPADLLKRRKGQPLNAEQALAARQILAKSSNELVNLSRGLTRKIAAGEASDADMAAFRAALVRHAAIQEQVAGATAEAGRALSQFRMVADSGAVKAEALKGLVDAAGGPEGIEAAANAIIDNAVDPVRLNTVVKTLARPGWKDKAIELWYNFLLSGPRTHAVNVTSNFLTSLAQIPEHAAAAAIGTPRRLVKGAHVDRVMFSETGARVVGWMQGAREGLRQFGRTIRTGEPSDHAAKVEAQSLRAISGVKGEVLRTPTRLLMAEDELFKAMARRMEIAGLSVRNARREGLHGAAARTRAAELTANPTPEMLEQAADYGRYLTFQRKLGPGGQQVSALTQKNPWLKLFIPFTRTPINLLKFAAERSPLAPAMKEVRDEFRAGGAKRDLAIARMAVGSGAAMLAVEGARRGVLTGGGPADESAKRLMIADGWQPYSVKVGDTYYSYQRLDPFSTTLGLAADYVDLQSHMTAKEQVAAILTGSVLQNLSSKSWLSGMSNLGEALSDWGRYGDNFVASLAGSAVPAVVGQSSQALDPVQREARSILDRVRSRLPGMSTALPPRRDVFGRELEGGNGGGFAAFSPIFTREARNDPTIRALIDSGIQFGAPSRTIGDPDKPGKKIELTPQQYSFYQQSAGQLAKPELDALVSGADWKGIGLDDRQKAVREIIEDARRDARAMLLGVDARETVPPIPPGFHKAPPSPRAFVPAN